MLIQGDRGWRGWVEAADTFSARWRGLMAREPFPLLLACSSVHGFWLRSPLRVVGLAADGTVIEVVELGPGRLVWIRGSRWILELPIDHAFPTQGERLTFVDGGGNLIGCPAASSSVPPRSATSVMLPRGWRRRWRR